MEPIEVLCTVLVCSTKSLLQFICPHCHQKQLTGLDFKCRTCSQIISDYKICDVRQVCAPRRKRKPPPPLLQRQLLEDQEFKCLYCLRPFGTQIIKNGNPYVLRPVFDHILPFNYCFNNDFSNFAATCQFCNSFKSDRVFKDIEAIQRFCREKWITNLKSKTIRIEDDD